MMLLHYVANVPTVLCTCTTLARIPPTSVSTCLSASYVTVHWRIDPEVCDHILKWSVVKVIPDEDGGKKEEELQLCTLKLNEYGIGYATFSPTPNTSYCIKIVAEYDDISDCFFAESEEHHFVVPGNFVFMALLMIYVTISQ